MNRQHATKASATARSQGAQVGKADVPMMRRIDAAGGSLNPIERLQALKAERAQGQPLMPRELEAKLGRALVLWQIGLATDAEVEAARALREQLLRDAQDWKLMLDAMASVEEELSREWRARNTAIASATLERARKEYEVSRDKFAATYHELSRGDGRNLRPAAKELFDLARKARCVGDVRRFFASLSNRPKGAVLRNY